eukprot:3460915-Rhodomonas_salina.3
MRSTSLERALPRLASPRLASPVLRPAASWPCADHACSERRGNSAKTYGPDIASWPVHLDVDTFQKAYIPGQDVLDFVVSMRDAQGQTVRADPAPVLSFLVSASICAPGEAQCSMWTSLQPDSFFFLDAGQQRIASTKYQVLLQHCVVGHQSIEVPLLSRDPSTTPRT